MLALPRMFGPTFSGTLEHEVKFIVPASATVPLDAWLSSACRPDPVYPPARVVTVYLDSDPLTLLDEKVNSDYLKRKVRARWYAPLVGAGRGPAFLETKNRIGNRREKPRTLLPVDASELETWRLADRRWTDLIERMARSEAAIAPSLLPSIRLTYTRRRYYELATGARVVLDSDIVATDVHPRIRGNFPAALNLSVLECKSLSADPPAALGPVVRFGARRGAVSKYLETFRVVTGTSQ